MSLWNIARALLKPNGILRDANTTHVVAMAKTVLCWSFGSMDTSLYPKNPSRKLYTSWPTTLSSTLESTNHTFLQLVGLFHGVNHVLHHRKVLIFVITMPTIWFIVALLQLSILDVILIFIASLLFMSRLPTIIALYVFIYLQVLFPWTAPSLAPRVSRVITSSSIGLVFLLLLLVLISWMAM